RCARRRLAGGLAHTDDPGRDGARSGTGGGCGEPGGRCDRQVRRAIDPERRVIGMSEASEDSVSENKKLRLDSIERAVQDIAAGKAVVVIDDEDRENEGDLIFAAEKATPELVAFMVRYTSGY